MKRQDSTLRIQPFDLSRRLLLSTMLCLLALPVHAGSHSFPTSGSDYVCGTNVCCGSDSMSCCTAGSGCPTSQCLNLVTPAGRGGNQQWPWMGQFWSQELGHMVSEQLLDTLSSVTDAVFYLNVDNSNNNNPVDLVLSINGTNVAHLDIEEGYANELTMESSFSSIAGTPVPGGGYHYDVVLRVTNNLSVCEGASISIGGLHHELELSYTPTAGDADAQPSFKVTKKPLAKEVLPRSKQ